MSRRKIAAVWTVVMSVIMLPSAQAQGPVALPQAGLAPSPIRPATYSPQGLPQTVAYRQPVGTAVGPGPTPIDADQIASASGPAAMPAPAQGGYVRLGAPMYPSPRPNIPIWSGSTMITNQALAPQEMLYPHTYRAIYPPFYHKVRGGWIVTPLGVRSHERWELEGTKVEVKYRSSYPVRFPGRSGIHQRHPIWAERGGKRTSERDQRTIGKAGANWGGLKMRHGIKSVRWLTAVVAVGLVTAAGWAAEKNTSSTALDRRETNQSSTRRTSSNVTQTGFSDVQDSVMDQTEALTGAACPPVKKRRLISRTCQKIRDEHDKCHAWFSYIRGNGPAIWVRNN